ncbi:MAG: FG-GAP repeat protein [Rivularia sp. (in: Bacteria)]|nr:FG-GAP repeat protein [Rivularia sp. MS3]
MKPALIPLIFSFLAKNKWVERAKINLDDRRIGNDIAINENTAVIIVPGDIVPQSPLPQFAVRVYMPKSNSWKLQTKLFVPETQFVDVDNDIILAANRSLVNKDEQNLPIYILTRSNDTWSLQTQLKLPQPLQTNINIAAVALKADTAIFAVPRKTYVFRRHSDTNNWFYEAELETTGRNIAIDGNTIIVGGSKPAYVFVRDLATGNWSQQTKLSPIAEDDNSPTNVDICGNTAVVGRPAIQSRRGAVDVYERNPNTNEWSLENRFFPSDVPWKVAYGFGASVTIDNNTIVVGASRKDIHDSMPMQLVKDKTAAYVIERNTQTGKWSQPVKLLPKDYKQVARGYAREVRISGNKIIVTSPSRNRNFATDNVYIFERVDS